MLISIVAQQQARGMQVAFCGDSQQAVYGFTGARNALRTVEAGRRLFLTQSWRFGPAVAEVANVILDHLHAELRLKGNPNLNSRVGEASLPDAILCRTNAAAVSAVLSLQKQGRKVHLVGGAKDVVSFARAAAQLQAGGSTTHPELACFDTWNEVREYAKNDPSGGDLKLMVRLLDEFGVQIVLDALGGMIGEAGAEVIVSTAHSAKGREWGSVRVSSDFPPETTGEAGRLLYVAVTRAQELLDVRFCQPVTDLMKAKA